MFKSFLQQINEGMYDSFVNTICKLLMQYTKESREDYIEMYGNSNLNQEGYDVFSENFYLRHKNLNFTIEYQIRRKKTKNPRGVEYDGGAYYDENKIEVIIDIDPAKEPQNYKYLLSQLMDIVEHEIKHLVDKPEDILTRVLNYHKRSQIDEDPKQRWKYFILDEEIPSMVRGLAKKAKHNKTNFKKEALEYLKIHQTNGNIQNKKQLDVIMDKWLDYYKRHFKMKHYG